MNNPMGLFDWLSGLDDDGSYKKGFDYEPSKPLDYRWNSFKDNNGSNTSFYVGSGGREFHIHNNFNGPASYKDRRREINNSMTAGDALWRSGILEYWNKYMNPEPKPLPILNNFLAKENRNLTLLNDDESDKDRYIKVDIDKYLFNENLDSPFGINLKLINSNFNPDPLDFSKATHNNYNNSWKIELYGKPISKIGLYESKPIIIDYGWSPEYKLQSIPLHRGNGPIEIIKTSGINFDSCKYKL